jgi:hypothetical protein
LQLGLNGRLFLFGFGQLGFQGRGVQSVGNGRHHLFNFPIQCSQLALQRLAVVLLALVLQQSADGLAEVLHHFRLEEVILHTGQEFLFHHGARPPHGVITRMVTAVDIAGTGIGMFAGDDAIRAALVAFQQPRKEVLVDRGIAGILTFLQLMRKCECNFQKSKRSLGVVTKPTKLSLAGATGYRLHINDLPVVRSQT